MIKNLLCTAVVLLSATALRADVFSFSYSGTGTDAMTLTGTVTATLGIGGFYNVTAISGTGQSTGGLFGTQSFSISKGSGIDIFSLGSGSLFLNLSDKPFGDSDVFTFAGSTGSEAGVFGATTGRVVIARAPEPAVLTLLLTMGLGVWLVARKLPSRKTPIS